MSTATAEEGDVPTVTLLACVLAGVVVAIGTFTVTYDMLLSMGAYIITACFSYALTWVMQ